MDDTGKCVPESVATLLLQQKQLIERKRSVQMFPEGTEELPLPFGFCRFQNKRGIFHYCPQDISAKQIDGLSGIENLILCLGPYSKSDVSKRIEDGEELLFITEYTPSWVEVRSAAGTNKTVEVQKRYFEKTKESGNKIVVGMPPSRVISHLTKG